MAKLPGNLAEMLGQPLMCAHTNGVTSEDNRINSPQKWMKYKNSRRDAVTRRTDNFLSKILDFL